MTDIRHKKTTVSQLDIGMFVCELDRPWLGTPFLLEGVLIENDDQIRQMKGLCEFVYVDHTFSTGKHYIHPNHHSNEQNVENIAHVQYQSMQPNKHESNKLKTKSSHANNNNFSFFKTLQEIKGSNRTMTAASYTGESENVLLYLSSGQSNATPQHTENNADERPSLASQIKSDFTNFVLSLRYWKQWQKKSRLHHDSNKNSIEINDATIKQIDLSDVIVEEITPVEQEIARIYPLFEQSQVATREIFEAFAQNQKIDLANIDETLNGMVKSIESNPDALIWLAKLKQTDNYSYNHALNVSITLMAMANFLSLSKQEIKELGFAGLLQDIGKVKIPVELLQKEGKITEDEFELLKKHVDYALELLNAAGNIPDVVIQTIVQHHERIDGSGYPARLSGKEISLAGQLAGLIDTYCAITSTKPYAKGVYNQIALDTFQTLRETKFSGVLIDQLVQFMGMYPVTTLVELNSGEVAVVIQQNSVRRLLPRVMILLNPDKTKNKYPPTINLINSPYTPSGEPYRIVRSLPPNSYGLNINNYFD